MTTMTTNDELLTIQEFADIMRIDDTTARRWIKQGILDAISLPHRNQRTAYRIRRSTLQALLTTPAQS